MKRNTTHTTRPHRPMATPHFRKVHAVRDRRLGFDTACRRALVDDTQFDF